MFMHRVTGAYTDDELAAVRNEELCHRSVQRASGSGDAPTDWEGAAIPEPSTALASGGS